MQFPPDEQELICRAFHVEGKAIRQIERETDHSRQAIRRAISDEPSARKSTSSSPFRSAPIFGPFQAYVEALIAQNDHLPRKQRYTSHRIFELIQAEGNQGCESRVRQHLAAFRVAIAAVCNRTLREEHDRVTGGALLSPPVTRSARGDTKRNERSSIH